MRKHIHEMWFHKGDLSRFQSTGWQFAQCMRPGCKVEILLQFKSLREIEEQATKDYKSPTFKQVQEMDEKLMEQKALEH